jgi:hypothetical protein
VPQPSTVPRAPPPEHPIIQQNSIYHVLICLCSSDFRSYFGDCKSSCHSWKILVYSDTAHRHRVLSTPHSYSGDPPSDLGSITSYTYWSGGWWGNVSWFIAFLCTSRQIPFCLKLGYDLFSPLNFRFVIYPSSRHMTLFNWAIKSIIK